MKAGHNAHQSRGFTLVELMIAIAILAILVVIAVPNISRQLAQQRNAQTVNILEESLQFALVENAIRRQAITFILDGNTISVAETSDSSNTIKSYTLHENSQVTLSSTSASLDSTGSESTSMTNFVVGVGRHILNSTQTDSLNVTFVVCDQSVSGLQGRRVKVNAVGRITTDKYGSCS